jgi:hypothetical protein
VRRLAAIRALLSNRSYVTTAQACVPLINRSCLPYPLDPVQKLSPRKASLSHIRLSLSLPVHTMKGHQHRAGTTRSGAQERLWADRPPPPSTQWRGASREKETRRTEDSGRPPPTSVGRRCGARRARPIRRRGARGGLRQAAADKARNRLPPLARGRMGAADAEHIAGRSSPSIRAMGRGSHR